VLNVARLEKVSRKHPDARAWLELWRETAEAAQWRRIQDIRVVYPSADGVKLKSGLVVTVFNVRGNEYRLLTSIHYERADVYVLDVLTHAEYDKEKWKARL
jgi:mRNA interferase HigB